MFCKYFKLLNGENIIVTTANDCNDFKDKKNIEVYDPVLIKNLTVPQGPFIVETFTMQPWIKVAKSGIIQIPTQSIIVITDVHESALDQYKKFIEEISESETKVEEVQDDEFQNVLEFLEEQEEDDAVERATTSKYGKTIH